MKLPCAAIVTFAAMLMFVTLARTTERSTDVLLKLEAELMTAISGGGYDAAMPYFADDGALLPRGGGIVTGKVNIRKEMGELEPGETLEWTPVKADIAASGDLGYTYGTSVFTEKSKDGKSVRRYGKYVTIWKKQKDGNWKIVLDMGSPRPAPTSR
jgi:ketosteroid isomerase-like protein